MFFWGIILEGEFERESEAGVSSGAIGVFASGDGFFCAQYFLLGGGMF